MEIANCTLWLTKLHSIPRREITPAEFVILRKVHAIHDGRIEDVKIIGDIPRSTSEELDRLLLRYRADYVNGKDGAFPGGAPSLPQRFADLPEPPETTPYVAPPEAPPITKHPSSQEWDKEED